MKFFLPALIKFAVLWTLVFLTVPVSATNYPPSQIPSGQLRFIENKNQWDSKILYNAKIPGGDLFLEKNTFTYCVFNGDDLKKIHPLHELPATLHGHAWKENFVGANPNPAITAVSPSLNYSNYFLVILCRFVSPRQTAATLSVKRRLFLRQSPC